MLLIIQTVPRKMKNSLSFQPVPLPIDVAWLKIILKNAQFINVHATDVTHCNIKLVRNDKSRTNELRANVKKILKYGVCILSQLNHRIHCTA